MQLSACEFDVQEAGYLHGLVKIRLQGNLRKQSLDILSDAHLVKLPDPGEKQAMRETFQITDNFLSKKATSFNGLDGWRNAG